MAKRLTASGKRLFLYEGNNHKALTSGAFYCMADFADAISISPQTIQSRFKHRGVTRVVRDCDLFPVRALTSRCRMIQYQGEHKDLVSGQSYSYVQLGKAFGISEKLIRERMRGSRVFINDMALTTPGVQQIVRCETRSSKVMDQWLRRKLV